MTANKTTTLGILMDPIAEISIHKDSSFAMLLEAQARGYAITYFEPRDVYVREGKAYAHGKALQVEDNPEAWFVLGQAQEIALGSLDIILIRNDPPFDAHYLYLTQILELAEAEGTVVVNKPASVRDFNEKLAACWFAEFMPPHLVSMDLAQLKAFVKAQGKAVVKPLDAMGGSAIFVLEATDPNVNVILETATKQGTELVMVQQFLPEIAQGDKRILLVDGEPIPYALARIPGKGEFRGNLAKGARAQGQPLSARDLEIAKAIGPVLKSKGLLFVGLDVIGEYVTEINVTSPTCIRELDAQFGLNIAGQLFDALEKRRLLH